MRHIYATLVLFAITNVNHACKSRSYTATTFPTFVENLNYGNNEDCIFDIVPANRSQYYLEITTHKFGIQGGMPNCEEDFMEIFTTRSHTSIGKFCSNNTHGGPFTVYSVDGYARIRFFSNAVGTGTGFQLSFELKPFAATLGSNKADFCIKTYTVEHTGVLHSTGWPLGYVSSTACEHRIENAGKQELRIIIMDLDAKNRASNGCDKQDDFIQIRGNNEKNELKIISDGLCKDNQVRMFKTRYAPVYIQFTRQRGSGSNRGYVIGYKTYDFIKGTESPDDNRKNSSNKTNNDRNMAGRRFHAEQLAALGLLVFLSAAILVNI